MRRLLLLSLGLSLVAGVNGEAAGAVPETTRASVTSDEAQVPEFSAAPSISRSGRYVVFQSPGAFAPGGSGITSVFVRDRSAGTTSLVSPNAMRATISANGRFVAFVSDAALVGDDSNGTYDVHVKDLLLGSTTRVSVNSREEQTGGQSWLGFGNAGISADGRYISFFSSGRNLVPGDTNLLFDVFVRDQQRGTTTRVSVSSSEAQARRNNNTPTIHHHSSTISRNGRFVSFVSGARNLVPHDTNEAEDVFVRDRRKGTTTRMSVSSAEKQAKGGSQSPAISGNGRFVVFTSVAKNLIGTDTNGAPDVFVRDRRLGITRRVSIDSDEAQANGASFSERTGISDDGRFIAFESTAALVADDTNGHPDVYLRDRETGSTIRVSVSSTGAQTLGESLRPSLSGDGRFVTFQSTGNLVDDDTNGMWDVFVYGPTN